MSACLSSLGRFARPFPVAWAVAALALAPDARAQCGDEVVLVHLPAGTTLPVLRTPVGAPVLGGSFAFQVRGGAPFALGVLLYSGFENPIFDPMLGATIWPEPPWFAWFFGTDAEGNSPLVLNTPEVTDDLCGAMATFQGFVFDALVPAGFTISNAVRLRVGSVTEPLFSHTTLATAGGETFGDLAIGDLDEDGVRDLASVSGAAEGALWVRTGLVAGGFSLPQKTVLGGGASTSLELADLDDDGHLDVVRTVAGGVAVALGDGAAGFASNGAFAGGSAPLAAAIADLDEDGALDLALADSGGANVIVLLGDGSGGFGAAQPYFAGTGPGGSGVFDVAAGDLDQDGHQDLVAAVAFANLVSVLEGAGDGTFAAPATYAAALPLSLVVADLDGDTLLDLAVANAGAGELSVRLGAGDLSLGAATSYAVGAQPRWLEAADLDGDAQLDLVAHSAALGDVSVLLGNGDGTFATRPRVLYYVGASALAPTDVDLNGTVDLLVSVQSAIRVVPGAGDGIFREVQHYPIGPGSSPSIATVVLALGDVDHDGENDVLARAGNSLAVLLHEGDEFALSSLLTPSQHPRHVAVGDLNGDSHPDLVVTSTTGNVNGPSVYLGHGDGTFEPELAAGPLVPVSDFELLDMNGDGDLDIFGRSKTPLPTGRFLTGFGNGDGTFAPGIEFLTGFTPPSIDDFELGDFNGDTLPDLAFVGISPSFLSSDARVHYSNGDGTFGAPSLIITTPSSSSAGIRLADVDEDGDLDALLRLSGTIQHYRNDGFPAFTLVQTLTASTSDIRLADMDGDGDLDLVALDAGATDGYVAARIFPRLETGQFDAPFVFTTGLPAIAFEVGDLDVDGIPDLIVGAKGLPSGNFVILHNQVGE